MIRSAGIQVGNLIKDMNIGFDDDNLFILKRIPEENLQNQQFPLIRIDGLPTTQSDYVSNKKRFELVSCQINLYAKANQEIEKYRNKIESYLSTRGFECFFDMQDYDSDYEVHRQILRVSKNQNVKEFF